ncbi:hypothetical protein IHQ68_03475 [Chelatococcus sambhunathii]|uniref:Uncharacterized protein n=1 Tax=Chelatococcus sambhunathii TaxID=363953 RepID=A0ABU1DCC1_9HYPH|nr:hypothetical protein [Chelatococcus sambhunathii]MDR4305683.1 hypothetical protein [Chelatococcus sambhunathii]
MSIQRVALVLVASFWAGGGAFASDGNMKAGPRCGGSTGGVCFTFAPGGTTQTLSSIKYDAPSAGTVAVTVNGTMQCGNNNGVESNAAGVVDLAAQIVKDDDAPLSDGPGGSRYPMRLVPTGLPTTASVLYSNAVNLAATRIFSVKRGKNVFNYKITPLRVDTNAFCTLFNTGLQVIFSPK